MKRWKPSARAGDDAETREILRDIRALLYVLTLNVTADRYAAIERITALEQARMEDAP